MKWAFKAISAFWLCSPMFFIIGRAMGVWNTKMDWFILLGLMVMSGVSAFLNYSPEE